MRYYFQRELNMHRTVRRPFIIWIMTENASV